MFKFKCIISIRFRLTKLGYGQLLQAFDYSLGVLWMVPVSKIGFDTQAVDLVSRVSKTILQWFSYSNHGVALRAFVGLSEM